ncbi:ABC-F family ATP-binding cassette domain-containing protein [Pedobacter sp. MW01-1-1]|uniref:ABC-F family ATP-binding cassette domain-containing protein n=1 Tax=Pedobacter sp. MW01-1-1 TaxID=3383027 RepID=UPI003FED6A20
MLHLHNLSYIHPNGDLVFSTLHLALDKHEKIALIGNNGVGKSTLLKLVAQELLPSEGFISLEAEPYYVPQIFGQYNHLTISEALGIAEKINALTEILQGNTAEENFTALNDDWTIQERSAEALDFWGLAHFDLSTQMSSLSGGQKTKVFLAGMNIHQPRLILLDEPSNHLDLEGRAMLYAYIQASKSAMILVSHDLKLLNILNKVCELNKQEIKVYGGNFDFYRSQKKIENMALNKDIQHQEKSLRKAKEKERETLERQQKTDSRGKGKQEKAGVARIMMNTLRNKAENSTSKLKNLHNEKIENLNQKLQNLRSDLPDVDKMKFGFSPSRLHTGKILAQAKAINIRYGDNYLWKEPLSFQILSGERIVLKGKNGAGKTSLIQLILGKTIVQFGSLKLAENKSVYVDQDYSLLQADLTVYQQAQQFNNSALQEHEVKIRLNRFLFGKETWDKPCMRLSGGERMRLMLCCLTMSTQAPDLIVLDEPTNNLDIQNIEILISAINEYTGTLIVVSHDEAFLAQININRTLEL